MGGYKMRPDETKRPTHCGRGWTPPRRNPGTPESVRGL